MKIKKELALPTCAFFAVVLFCLLILSRCTPARHPAAPTGTQAVTELDAAPREEMAGWYAAY